LQRNTDDLYIEIVTTLYEEREILTNAASWHNNTVISYDVSTISRDIVASSNDITALWHDIATVSRDVAASWHNIIVVSCNIMGSSHNIVTIWRENAGVRNVIILPS